MSRRAPIFVAVLVCLAAPAGNAFAQSTPEQPPSPLLQPGEPYPDTTQEPIHLHPAAQEQVHLHPPLHRKTPVAQRAPAAPSVTGETSGTAASASPNNAEASPIIRLHYPRHATPTRTRASARVAKIAPQTAAPETIPFSLGAGSGPAAPATAPGAPARPAVAAARPGPSPSKAGGATRSVAVSGGGDRPDLKKRGAILFEKNAPSPSPAQYRGVKVLADNLNTALASGASGIQLEAYGGAPGDKSSDARRLSLRRALAVRQLLIDDGVPSARINVRAMGGADDKGPADRVDVFIRAA
ncbi:MAG TPA: OmpA family protein [Rhizomicrobium sp.]